MGSGLLVGWLPAGSWPGLALAALAYGLALLMAFWLLKPLSDRDQQMLRQLDARLEPIAAWFTGAA